jgi:hypothetical protein
MYDFFLFVITHEVRDLLLYPKRRREKVTDVNRRMRRPVSGGMRYAPKLSTRSKRKRWDAPTF